MHVSVNEAFLEWLLRPCTCTESQTKRIQKCMRARPGSEENDECEFAVLLRSGAKGTE